MQALTVSSAILLGPGLLLGSQQKKKLELTLLDTNDLEAAALPREGGKMKNVPWPSSTEDMSPSRSTKRICRCTKCRGPNSGHKEIVSIIIIIIPSLSVTPNSESCVQNKPLPSHIFPVSDNSKSCFPLLLQIDFVWIGSPWLDALLKERIELSA
jgi:hypothetical protein